MEWLNLGETALAFKRDNNFACIINFGSPFTLPDGEVLLSSSAFTGNEIPSDCGVWMRLK